MEHRDLCSGLVRLHVLYHACKEPIFGLGIIEELGQHGYRLGPGTIYPLLHRMEKKGYLRSFGTAGGRRERRFYRATAVGKKAFDQAKGKVRELFGEIFQDGDR